MPGVGAFDDPASGLAIDAAEQWSFAATPDVRTDASRTHGVFCVGVVVALVEAEVLGPPWAARSANDDVVEHIADHPLVVDVGTRDAHRQRYAARVGQHVTFHPAFRAVRRVGTGKVPPFGAFTVALSSEVHSH